jgi:guanylate kinase
MTNHSVIPVDTTRKPRPHEVHGKDYYFVEHPEFEKLIGENAFVEHAQFSGNRYGTSRKALADIQSTGRRPILDIDAQVRNKKFSLPTPESILTPAISQSRESVLSSKHL